MKKGLFLFTALTLIYCTVVPFGSMQLYAESAQPQPVPALKWEPQLTGTFESLRAVSAASAQTVWAGGTKGTVLRTIDGGKNWHIRIIPNTKDLDFRDVEAFDADNAVVVSAGSPAKIFKTNDGGKTWKETYSNTHKDIFFDSMAFWDHQQGIAFSDPIDGKFVVITTSNGGLTWTTEPTPPKAEPGEAGFAAGGTSLTVHGTDHAWFCTGGAVSRVIYSTDRGKTWAATASPILQGNPSQGGFSIAFKDALNGILVGGDYRVEKSDKKNIAVSYDGGKTWQAVTKNRPTGFRECIAYIPAMGDGFAIAVGPSGNDYTLDSGLSWSPFEGSGFHSFSLAPGGNSGWAVGRNGAISHLSVTVK